MKNNIYSRSSLSVKTLDIIIFCGLAAILLVTVYLSATGGFDVTFDTCGGSEIAAQRLRYGERIIEPDAPQREGYTFIGWYTDRSLDNGVDLSNAVATASVTFYAGWKEN